MTHVPHVFRVVTEGNKNPISVLGTSLDVPGPTRSTTRGKVGIKMEVGRGRPESRAG